MEHEACRTPTAVQLAASISGTVWYDIGGAPKLLAVLAVQEADLDIVAQGQAGNLDELRRERAQSTPGRTVDAPGTSSEGRR